MYRRKEHISRINDYGLYSLVDELLLIIIGHIDAHSTLCNLSITCSRFLGLVEPFIWRSLVVLKGDHARNIALALDNRKNRVDFIHELSIRYRDCHKDGIAELNHSLSLMTKLRHLTIESPCPNDSRWRSGAYFHGWSRIDFEKLISASVHPQSGLPPTLPSLQSLTLHAHGANQKKFALGAVKAAFFHPTLRRIALSCLNFDASIADEENCQSRRYFTPLTSLTLIECNVNIHFLNYVLGLPRALQELSVGERVYTFEGCEPSRDPSNRTSSASFLTALQKQASSLKKLVHCGGSIAFTTSRQTDIQGADKLRSLAALEHLELGIESHLYYYLREGGFPPALKRLRMLDAAISHGAGTDLHHTSHIIFHSMSSLVIQHLPRTLATGFELQLHFSDFSFFRILTLADPNEQDHLLSMFFLDRRAIYKIATVLRSLDARFVVSREYFPSGKGFIPPYMYGEEVPSEKTMYHSDDYWRFNGVSYRTMDDDKYRAELEAQRELFACGRCAKQGLSLEECRSLGDGSACLLCRRSQTPCTWGGAGQTCPA